jgi:beta-N-acetylhexosaminidase
VTAGAPAAVRAAVVGLAGPELTAGEEGLLRRRPPAGVVLFARNCRDRGQLRALVAAARATQPGRRLPVLIDQEGGRVMRLRPPEWRPLPPAAAIGAVFALDPAAGLEAAWLLGRLIAHDLAEVGIDVDCAPVVDVGRAETTDAIGDRAFARDPEAVAALAGAFAEGLMAGGVAPVLKHLPGHGRARVDSHHALPVVDAGLEELLACDLVPARRLASLPLAMTAHLLYRAVDPDRPGTLSPVVIQRLIREEAGFGGLLFSDDLAMKALAGDPGTRAAAAIAAGCDIALACTGRIEEGEAVLAAAPALAPEKLARLDAAVPPPASDGFDPDRGDARLRELLLGAPVS